MVIKDKFCLFGAIWCGAFLVAHLIAGNFSWALTFFILGAANLYLAIGK